MLVSACFILVYLVSLTVGHFDSTLLESQGDLNQKQVISAWRDEQVPKMKRKLRKPDKHKKKKKKKKRKR